MPTTTREMHWKVRYTEASSGARTEVWKWLESGSLLDHSPTKYPSMGRAKTAKEDFLKNWSVTSYPLPKVQIVRFETVTTVTIATCAG